MNRRHLLALPALALPTLASAQADRPIRLIVPVAPGGSQDIVARLIARHLGPVLGQNVVVENHPGAGSNIGYEMGARARPDGLTLIAGSDSLSINKGLFRRLSFDPVEDFAAVAQATSVPQILVVRSDFPAARLEDFVAFSRRNPVAIGTPGNGSLAHLLIELLQQATETRWTHAPYRGGALAVNDLLGGSLQGVMINIGAVTQHVQAGRLRGLAVSTGARTQALPEVPTLAEAGLANIAVAGWHGLVAPRATDPALIARLNQAVGEVLRHPELRERLAALGIEPVDAPPEALAAKLREDAARWAPLIRRTGMQPD
ncbi:tripartite tricarboxylate transporter substrate binding protein [Sediminicoccus sp. KRV36]|uniref:Bug family tripartite tricarboxylate transporter substrate binding protein n=1 Tax=Sediminicoccus sp. KRV36 TaxID=3133721 RepID=UPI00200F4B7F|nr:tripartite tricarboxylate transporter substrate binding protein [Sediminicoccus rosea]UPY38526.1 tripartite tricarboxylate transporter substrate binding protein [Sediminicoccus rosea]